MFAVCVLLLSVAAAGHSAPLGCEDLVRPLDQLHPARLDGTWALVAGAFVDTGMMNSFARRNSSSITFDSVGGGRSNISYTITKSQDGHCRRRTFNISLEGSTMTFDPQDDVNVTVTFLFTSCPDCVLMRYETDTETQTRTLFRLFLFSKRRQLQQAELQEFKGQVKCLNMLEPVVLDPSTDLCPLQETDAESG